jgi:hypothetical protein
MKFNNDFIGYRDPGSVYRFSGGDHEKLFIHNLKTQPDEWYYRNRSITYEINNLGHRCKNIDDIDLDNYILFTGCSHTEGIGLELEKTFPYLTANDLGMDYYNLALGGSGIDVMTHNLIMWIHTVKKLPKALIIMWPETTRYAHLDETDKVLHLELPSTINADSKKFMVMGDKLNFFETVRCMSEKIINAAYTCKTIHLETGIPQQGDKARDLCHAGILKNRAVADQLVQNLKG